MKAGTKDTLIGIFFILLIVLILVFMFFGTENADRKKEEQCKQNCPKYGLPFLNSEKISYIGYACFCLDVDGKPREVPSG